MLIPGKKLISIFVLILGFFVAFTLLFESPGFAAQSTKKGVKGNAPKAVKEAPLSNEDIIKLSKLGLGDEIVIAKIDQAKEINFNLDTDSLINLKKNGVTDKVITAMLKRSSGSESGKEISKEDSQPIPQAQPIPTKETSQPPTKPTRITSGVMLATKDGDFELDGKHGNFSMAGFLIYVKYMNYPGFKAKTRISDRRPFFLVYRNYDPTNNVFIIKLDQEKQKNIRFVKIGSAGSSFAPAAREAHFPDVDWTIPYQAKEESSNVWRLTIEKDLPPGEYGVYVTNEIAAIVAVLYDFGID